MKRIAARALVLGMIANAVLFAASCKEDPVCQKQMNLPATNYDHRGRAQNRRVRVRL